MNSNDDIRRVSPRVSCNWQVKCVTEQNKAFTTRTSNISQEGVQLFSPVTFKYGERLYLEINAYYKAEKHMIKVVGVIVYVSVINDEIRLGLKFVSAVTIENSKFLQKYVKAIYGG